MSNPSNPDGLKRFQLVKEFEEPEMQLVGGLALALAMGTDTALVKNPARMAGIEMTFSMLHKIDPRVSAQTLAMKSGIGCVLIQLGAGFAGPISVHASRCASDNNSNLGPKELVPVLLTQEDHVTVRNRDRYDRVVWMFEDILSAGGKCISHAWIHDEASGKYIRIDRVIWPAAAEGRSDTDVEL